jgi:hypothetical protein
VKKFPAFNGTPRFITVFPTARLWSISWATWVQSTRSVLFPYINSNIIVSSTPRSSQWSLPFRFSNQISATKLHNCTQRGPQQPFRTILPSTIFTSLIATLLQNTARAQTWYSHPLIPMRGSIPGRDTLFATASRSALEPPSAMRVRCPLPPQLSFITVSASPIPKPKALRDYFAMSNELTNHSFSSLQQKRESKKRNFIGWYSVVKYHIDTSRSQETHSIGTTQES